MSLLPHSAETFFADASAEAVLPALYPRLRALELLPQLPPGVGDSLEAVTQLNLERNQLILEQAHGLINALRSAGIQPVALKGLAYLIGGVYSDPATRYLLDIDLLIPQAQLNEAVAIVTEAGYSPWRGDTLAPFRHHAPQLRQDGHVPVELHRSIGLGLARRILPAEEIIAGATDLIPSPCHLVTHLIVHSQIHHRYSERIFPPLRAAYDLFVLQNHFGSKIGWPSIESRFRQHGQLATLQLHLLYVHETLGMPLPLPVRLGPLAKLRWLRRRLLNRHPFLRYIDPIYLLMSTLSRRVRLLLTIVATPGALKTALKIFSERSFYRRLLSDI